MPKLTRVFEITVGFKARVLPIPMLIPGEENRRARAPRQGSTKGHIKEHGLDGAAGC